MLLKFTGIFIRPVHTNCMMSRGRYSVLRPKTMGQLMQFAVCNARFNSQLHSRMGTGLRCFRARCLFASSKMGGPDLPNKPR